MNNSAVLSTDFTFKSGTAENSTTTVVDVMTNTGNDWYERTGYTYDEKGNIRVITVGGYRKAKYYYDELNQLIREENKWLNKTITYTYDNGGNILAVNEYDYTTGSVDGLTPIATKTYTYGASNWHDKLTYYNGNRITYDAIGNPLTYYNGLTFTWQDGRQLAGISGNGLTASYKYDADGIRTQKTVNGVTTNYVLEGDMVVKETNGTDTLWYYYDAAGSLVSFELNGTAYFYVKNMQGDITAIVDASSNKVVEYTYDSWGKLISTSGSLASTVGIKNPYRYRSYRYDTETGLYYLQSRYYDPEMKRFVNADNQLSASAITETNLFTYCDSNPINRIDPTGSAWDIIFDIISLISSAADVIQNPSSGKAWGSLVVDVVCTAVPFLPSFGAVSKVVSKSDDLIDAVKTTYKSADKVADVATSAQKVDSGVSAAKKIHGNSLRSNRINYGYALVDENDYIMKFGETINPKRRYTKKYLTSNGYKMKILEVGNKKYIHDWQYDMNKYYQNKYDVFPPEIKGKGW